MLNFIMGIFDKEFYIYATFVFITTYFVLYVFLFVFWVFGAALEWIDDNPNWARTPSPMVVFIMKHIFTYDLRLKEWDGKVPSYEIYAQYYSKDSKFNDCGGVAYLFSMWVVFFGYLITIMFYYIPIFTVILLVSILGVYFARTIKRLIKKVDKVGEL